MANDDIDLIDEDLEIMTEEPVDNAQGFTSGLVIGTTGVLLVALFVMMQALGTWFAVGPFAS